MADPVFSTALDFVLEVLDSRHRAGMGSHVTVRALRDLMDVPPGSVNQGDRANHPIAPHPPAAADLRELVAAGVDSREPAEANQQRPASPPVPQTSASLLSAQPLDTGKGTASERINALRSGAIVCQKCPALAGVRAQVVFGQGSVEAALMIIGEAPGPEEDQEGRPFAGEAGELLEKMLKAMGLPMGQVYATSVLKCHPFVPGEPGASRQPHAEELERCLPYLAAQIAIVRPKAIVAMGAGVMHALFGGKAPMGSLRSRWHEVQGIPVMPTFHPRYLLRNDDVRERRKVWEDLMQVMERLGLEVTQRHRSYFLKGA
jgi:uracil-DNA glycosylase family 4